jgi:dTDP-4-dehydrorhamnose 3,5-epimerase
VIDVVRGRLDGLLELTPLPRIDHRGFTMEVLSPELLAEWGIDATRFLWEEQTLSRRSTIRGLHASSILRGAHVMRCVRGRVYAVAVDLRSWSPTYLRWTAITLDDRTNRQVYVPSGLARGFATLSDWSVVIARSDEPAEAAFQLTVRWDDPDLAIRWPVDNPVISDADRTAPSLPDVLARITSWQPPAAEIDLRRVVT